MPVGLHSEAIAAGRCGQANARLRAEIDDLFLPAVARFDDRTRGAIAQWLDEVIGAIEGDIRRHAARALSARGDQAAAAMGGDATAHRRLVEADALRHPALMAEVIAQVRCRLLAVDLPVSAEAGEGPGLLVRLIDLPDRVVATAARALLSAEGHGGAPDRDLPAETYHRLTWLVAAALRDAPGATDRLLVDAAQRCLAGHDEGERAAALAARLVAAIDPLSTEVPALLVAALADRRPVLFAATLARAIAVPFEEARHLLLDPAGEGLWTALRAVGTARADIARIAVMLADADPRRDLDTFADRLDAIAAVPPETARDALAPLTLPVDFHRAVARLGSPR